MALGVRGGGCVWHRLCFLEVSVVQAYEARKIAVVAVAAAGLVLAGVLLEFAHRRVHSAVFVDVLLAEDLADRLLV